MKNTTRVRIPKRYQDMIEEVYNDSDGRGYWCFSKKGYYFSDMDYGVHIVREDTQKHLIDMIRSLRPCECEECKEVE